MEQRHLEEWLQLQRDATAILREGREIRDYRRHIQALMVPSFDDGQAYEILLPVSRGVMDALGTKTTWRKMTDADKFRSPVVRLQYGFGKLVPTIETFETALARADIEALLSHLSSFTVRAYVPESIMGLDGTTYELALGKPYQGSRYSWWERPPAGWEVLGEILEQTKEMIDHYLPGAV